MFKNDFVVAVKCKNEILREFTNVVCIPFGSEYSILLKNLNTVKALVSISIDGQDVLYGNKIIVSPNSSIELERFLETNDKGHKFKFIQKTDKVREHRGDKIDDGIIRVEFQFEKQIPAYDWVTMQYPITTYYNQNDYKSDCRSISSGDTASPSSITPKYSVDEPVSKVSLDYSLEDGITVNGGISEQKFVDGHIGELEKEKHVITLQLRGMTDNKVKTPITVKTKLKCEICGIKNNSNHKYCIECGNCLIEL